MVSKPSLAPRRWARGGIGPVLLARWVLSSVGSEIQDGDLLGLRLGLGHRGKVAAIDGRVTPGGAAVVSCVLSALTAVGSCAELMC